MLDVSPDIHLMRAAVTLAYLMHFLRWVALLALAAVVTGLALWASA